jgi:sigma-54-specific transcriptional regulator
MSDAILTGTLIGESLAMRRLRTLIARVASSTIPILIEGETGAGKELVARALHQLSGRGGAMVAFNVCAIADTMFEDALFGHVRGAYTGAVQSSPGYLAEANGGTLFLDEIGGLPQASQAKLLRAIETKQFRPVGGMTDRRSDFRVVAASNEPVDQLVHAQRFRRDLAQRLGGVRIEVPPLRGRADDIPLLIQHFSVGAGDHERSRFTEGAIRHLREYDWPGNVRELRYVVEASLTLAIGSLITRADVEVLTRRTVREAWTEMGRTQRDTELLSLLDRSSWDVAEAARHLGVHRATIYRHLQRLKQQGTMSA